MLNRYWQDIEQFPLQNWLKCNDGDLRFARLEPLGKSTLTSKSKDAKAWETIYNDFLRRVEPSDQFTELIELILERAELQHRYNTEFENGMRIRRNLNPMNDLTNRIRNIHMTGKSEKTMSVTKILNAISKRQGYQVQIKDLTTLAYFELLKEYNA